MSPAPAGASRQPPNDLPADPALAGAFAHELNNISAALYGFVELAADGTPPPAPLSGYLAEMRVGVRRLQAVAAILEALAETAAEPRAATLGECLEAAATASTLAVQVRWRCDADRTTHADPHGLGKGLTLLALLEPPAPTSPGVVWSIEAAHDPASVCADCQATLPAAGALISVQSNPPQRWPEPEGRARRTTETKIRRVHRAALGRLLHLAGAHLLNDGESDRFEVWLPVTGDLVGQVSARSA